MKHDLILRGGTVFDGLGNPGVAADVAITGDRVCLLGTGSGRASRLIDVTGLAVAPGFLDPHSHSDMVPLMAEPQPFKLLQGVTTEIAGNCGYSFAPLTPAAATEAATLFADIAAGVPILPLTFAEYLDAIEAAKPTNNMAVMVGHNTLRLTVAGMDTKLPEDGVARMRELAAQAFAAGAAGFSSGLIYPPGCYSDIEEVVALAEIAHAYGKPYATHMRNEDRGLAEALDEAIEIARRARVKLQVSHCKAAGRSNHGGSVMLLDKLRQARLSGVDARGDQYPYLAGGTFLGALLPGDAHAGGVNALRERLSDPATREALRQAATTSTAPTGAGLWRETGPGDILVTSHATRPEAIGKTLAQLPGDPWETACDLILADPSAGMVITMMDEADVRTIMADPLIAIGSDNGMPYGLQHPRTWGCFPRFLGRYVRELGIVALPEAIRKVTSATAVQFGLTGRGWLGDGAIADVTVFDPATIAHDGDYLTPDVAPTGVQYVVLAGTVVVDSGTFTGVRAGRVLR